MVSFYLAQDIGGHIRILRLVGILHDDRSSSGFDGQRASDAVVECAGENDGNNLRSVDPSGAAEQGVYGRPVAVFARSMGREHTTIVHREVTVGRRNIDAASLDGFRLEGADHLQ